MHLCALLLCLAQTQDVETIEPIEAGAPAASTPSPETTGEPRGPRIVLQRLEELATTYPDRVTLVPLGESAAGRPIVAAVLGAEGAPALFVGDHAAGDLLEGGESALRLIEELVVGVIVGEDPLADRQLIVVPTLDPDRSARVAGEGEEGAEPGDARFERDFPVGWVPPGLVVGAGPTPLVTPEARSLTAFLAGRRNVVLALGFETAGEALPACPDLAPEDEAAQLMLAGSWIDWDLETTPRLCWTRPPRPSGTWLDLARGVHGSFVAAAAWGDAGQSVAWDTAHAAFRAKVLRLLEGLPLLRFGEPRVRQLGDGLWQVDVPLENRGTLPTASARGLALGRVNGGRLIVEGAELLAAALRGPTDADFRVVPVDGTVPLGALDGGKQFVVRLVLRGSAEAEVALACESDQAGGDALTVVLK